MKLKILAMLLAVVGLASVTTLSGTSSAAAEERVFDVSTMTWKKVDPLQRMYTKKNPPAKYNRRTVSFKTDQPVGTVIIHTDEKFLYHVLGNGKATRYGVGVGREGFTWGANNLKIQRKAKWPSWTPPAEMRARERAKGRILPVTQKGGIDNPLGARALYLYKNGRDTIYRIHGTNEPWSIGLNLSSGCIRMMNDDVEHLYERTKIGTKVVVIGEGEDHTKYFTTTTNPFAALFDGSAFKGTALR